MRCRRSLLILLFIAISVSASAMQNYEPVHVLYLNSYDHRMNWSENILRGIEDILLPDDNNINLHYEAMDTKEFFSAEYIAGFRDYIEMKYGDYRFSLIFCSDNNAVDFMIDYHRELFPGVPIVFCGVNNFDAEMLNNHTEFTGIAEVPSIRATVETALKFHPETEEIFIINDYLKTGKAWRAQIESDLRYLKDRIKLTYSDNTTIEELKDAVSALSAGTIILYSVYYSDVNGYSSSYEKMALSIADVSHVPVYTLTEFSIQKKVVGGKVISGYLLGEAMAEIGKRILAGEEAVNIPIAHKEYNRYIFNYQELERFSITEKELPEESIIVNRPFSFFEQYKREILFSLITVCVLLFAVFAVILNISSRTRAEKEYAYLQNLWDNVFENSMDGIIIHDSNRICERINRSVTKLTGYLPEELLGKSAEVLDSGNELDTFNDKVKASLIKKGNWSGEVTHRRKSGETYFAWLSISIIGGESGSSKKYVVAFHDISDLKRHEEELKRVSQHDALTGFTNRTFFLDILSTELKASERSGEICAVMLLNLDGLKNINNTYGFLAGDQIIKEFSIRLREGLREEDLVSRFGGDEFAVLAPRFKDKNQVITVIKRIRNNILRPIIIDDNVIDLSVSIGISMFPFDGVIERELIAKSSIALKRAKENRKGSYSLYNSEQDKAVLSNSELEMSLQKALSLDELDVFYQPKVNPFENKIKGFEALIRWNRNHTEWVPPGVFIPISEDNGYIIEIGYFVITRACDFILRLKEYGFKDFHVGVNISAKQFSDPNFIDSLIKIVENLDIKPSELDLEVTESITAGEVFNTIECLTRLSEYGFSISIDDFGTGYSSLKYLMTLPFDTIKIDKSFIDSILEGESRLTILNTMISLAHSLQKNIVAEGVETEEQVNYLIEHNCGLIQGYYYSKPLPADEIFKLVESGSFN